MSRNYVPISQPAVGKDEWEAMLEPMQTGWLTQGPMVRQFEAEFAERHQVPHAVATSTGTSALHLALVAVGVGPGDEVILPAFTFVATANAVLYCGATPVFVDVEHDTFNLDPVLVASALTPRTRAVVAVHLFGLCADVDAVRQVVGPNVAIVEDAACAAGASLDGHAAGSLGDVGCFSFHPRKVITTGEGGMITTTDELMVSRIQSLRNHGASLPTTGVDLEPRPYKLPEFGELGFNYRMTDFQAAIGRVQLRKLDSFIAERDTRARWYSSELAELGWLRTPTIPERAGHSWQAFVTVVDEDAPIARDELMARLERSGVATRPGTHAVPALAYYRNHLGAGANSFPVSMFLHRQSMAIPLHNRMTSDDYGHVVSSIFESVTA